MKSIYQVYTRYIPCLNFLGFPDALAEEIRMDTRFVTQVSGHLGCHDRSKVRAQDELKEKIKHAKEEADKAKAHLEELEEDLRTSGIRSGI